MNAGRKSMRIVHVIQDILPQSGGPPAVAIDLSRQQSEEGDDVTILCPTRTDTPGTRELLRVRLAGAARSPKVIGASFGRGGSSFVRQTLTELNPDVVHLHAVFCPALSAAATWCDRRHVPYVCSTHGMLHPSALATHSLKKRIFSLVFPRILRGPNWLLTLNAEEADHASRLFNPRSCVIENGVNIETAACTTADEFLGAFPMFRGRPYALFVGRLHPIKGIDRLITAYGKAVAQGLPEDLVIIGPEEGAGQAIAEATRIARVAGRVHVLPPMYGVAKASAIAGCSLFVHRPRYEGFGVAVVEAMAAERPVVTTARCHLDRAFAAGALTPAADTDQGFADAMLAASADARTENLIGTRGARWVRENLAWPRISERIRKLYLTT
jgi:glycosyltransferase involved in cell wall biosynthesis